MNIEQQKNIIFTDNNIFFDKLTKVLSEERLKAYQVSDQATQIDRLAAKAWNMALCGSLYPILQLVEISLRNSIHNAMSNYIGKMDWFCDPEVVGKREFQLYQNTLKNLEQLHRKSDPNHILSELNFGFWTNLLSREYERNIWHPLIKRIFPNCPKNMRRRSLIFQRYMAIRKLRNRVFHHQRIWHISDLEQKKTDVVETMFWIEPAIILYVQKIDTFEKVYQQGIEFYKGKIAELI